MSAQSLLEKIAADAAAQVSVINTETSVAVSTIEAAATAESDAIAAAAKARATKASEQVARTLLSQARQLGKIVVQEARRSVVDAVLADAKQQFAGDDPEKQQLFSDKQAQIEIAVANALRNA